MTFLFRITGGLSSAPILVCAALAQTNFMDWPVIDGPFPSTGGGGVIIENYAPVISGALCATRFTARLPDGQRLENRVEFDAAPVDGGTLCSNGRWTSLDGSASGTTPLQVFIRDGVARRSP